MKFNTESTNYTLGFVFVLTAFVALVLTILFSGWKEKSEENEAIFNKRAILEAVGTKLDKPVSSLADREVLDIFNNQIQQVALDSKGDEIAKDAIVNSGYKSGKPEDINMKNELRKPSEKRVLPMYIFGKGKDKTYILSLRGNGLWDEIWGYVALNNDFNTVAGVAFDHKGETPGMGAEIKDNANFKKQFIGKKIFDDNGNLVSLKVHKGKAKVPSPHEVDGITGATLTGNGLSKMLQTGIKNYENYLKKHKK